MKIRIRGYRDDDTVALAELFYRSVRYGTEEYYDRRQRDAWAPSVPDTRRWAERLAPLETFVAEDEHGVAGFMTLGRDGHIDLAYVRPDVIGKGIAYELYVALELAASRLGLNRLFTEASEMARPFFERQGWTLVETQSVDVSGVSLTNHRMEKQID